MTKLIVQKKRKNMKLPDFLQEAKEKKLIKSYKLPKLEPEKCGRYVSFRPIIDGIKFDSGLEAEFYLYLLEKLKNKEIKKFESQVDYELLPNYKIGKKKRHGVKYVADFVVTYLDGHTAVYDVKGKETADFKIKKKMFEYKYKVELNCIQLYKGEWLSLDEIKGRKTHREKTQKSVKKRKSDTE